MHPVVYKLRTLAAHDNGGTAHGHQDVGVRAHDRRAIAGARRTLNMTAVPTGEFYNVATNRVADPGAVPGRDTPGRLRRRNDTAHRTRPW